MTTKIPKIVWTNPIQVLAVGFGSGLSPVMPGTCGTVVGVLLYLIIQDLNLWVYTLILFILTLFAIWICDKAAAQFGEHDHPSIVLDEIVGYLLTMLSVPKGWLWVILGFVYFRIFDIVKPWPIRWMDRKVSGGFGIVLDDLIAGVFAAIVLQFSVWFLMPLFSS